MAADSTDRIELPIDGMTCAGCVASATRALEGVTGVSAAAVNLATRSAMVTVGPEVTEADLRLAVEQAGYTVPVGEREDDRASIDRRLRAAVPLTVLAMVLAMVPAVPDDLAHWGSALAALPVYLWAGADIHARALSGLRHRVTSMDTLITMGTTAAVGWSVAGLMVDGVDAYFETAAVIITLVLVGRRLEAGARRSSGSALRALLDLAPATVTLADGREVPFAELRVGDRFMVRPGERLAADGTVVEGFGSINASMLTGEPLPVDVVPGDEVAGGTVNTTGVLTVEADRTGDDATVVRLARMVADAQAGRAPAQRLVDRVSAVFVPLVLVLATATLTGRLLIGHTGDDAVTAAVTVLIIACPCALGLATPTALQVGTGRAAQLGVLLRSAGVLETTRRLTTVVVDKTGTLTNGRMSLVDLVAVDDHDRSETLRLAAAVEAGSEHPVGRAIAAAVDDAPWAVDVTAEPGFGISGTVDGRMVAVGRLSDEAAARPGIADLVGRGHTIAEVTVDGTTVGAVAVGDTVRPEARQAVERLHALGLHVVMLTGDGPDTAQRVAAEVGIGEVVAGVRPDGKVQAVLDLRSPDAHIAMVGDGLNDTPALAAADLGIAIGGGTDAATEAAGVVLLTDDLRAVADAIALSRRTVATIRTNLVWAFLYNVAALPLAVAGALAPPIAAGAMVASSLFVVGNSLRLRSFTGSTN